MGRHHPLTYVYGQDPGCHAMLYLMHCLLFLGYPDQALAMGEGLTDLAEELGHPLTPAFALSWKTVMLAECDAWERVAQCAGAVEAICTRHGFPTWLSSARAWQGYLAYQAGDRGGGLDQMGAAFGAALDTGAQAAMPYYIRLYGEMSGGAGHLAAGLELTRHALEMALNHDEGWCETAVRLTLADLLWQAGDPAAAETQIRLGLAKARAQQARFFELRAALHLHRLGVSTGSAGLQAEARAAVAAVYAWFGEGLELPLLAEARRLLEASSLEPSGAASS